MNRGFSDPLYNSRRPDTCQKEKKRNGGKKDVIVHIPKTHSQIVENQR